MTARSFAFPTARWAPAAMFGAYAVLPLVVLVAPGASVGVRAGAAVVAAVFLACAWRCARFALVVDARGVVVRNLVRTTRIPWSDVDAFVSKRWLRGMPYEIGAVRRRSGATVLALGLTPPFGDPARLVAVLAELEALRAEQSAVAAAR
jgi:hypothetical protein